MNPEYRKRNYKYNRKVKRYAKAHKTSLEYALKELYGKDK